MSLQMMITVSVIYEKFGYHCFFKWVKSKTNDCNTHFLGTINFTPPPISKKVVCCQFVSKLWRENLKSVNFE